ncbi:23S ribosomal RNA methyltransferase Erm [Gordonia sp. PKS22-38]|uniref:23S ribosomal RNA methyltransferase Erm n=1 Tax=Gordonia prachuapensis TaxID=3115651 RepID=A0ABU7MY70_9ACTN|nr:23S ribosomal RNA methyltransferase Erm [Gordonia sp. PKS22-38]
MPAFHAGRHENGQNFLSDHRVIDHIVELVAHTDGPIVEIGSGAGALTIPLQHLRRPIEAVEIDTRLARSLGRRADPALTSVVCADFLHHRLPHTPHAIVGNLPFHQTTAILRRLLRSPHWTHAVLVTQWEVARRRAGVGGATMMTAQWWPWYDFGLAGRVPAAAFAPRPGVDGGLLTISRRTDPLLNTARRSDYQGFVHAMFTGSGRGLGEIAGRVVPADRRGEVRRWISAHRLHSRLPRDLAATQWATLYRLGAPEITSAPSGTSRSSTPRTRQARGRRGSTGSVRQGGRRGS